MLSEPTSLAFPCQNPRCIDGGLRVIMRGAGWIRGLREAEALELRRGIRQLELDLIEAANSKGKGKLQDIAHRLRWQKTRLERLEECLAAMPVGRPFQSDQAGPEGASVTRMDMPVASRRRGFGG
jgi:hypothetical protein